MTLIGWRPHFRASHPIRSTHYLKAPLRLRAAYTSDSTNYPYDTQFTELQIQSRDYSTALIEITTKSINKAYGLDEFAKDGFLSDFLLDNAFGQSKRSTIDNDQ